MNKIKLSSKKYTRHALVDEEDFERLSKHKWFVQMGSKDHYYDYAWAEINGKKHYMHRFVTNPSKDMSVHHIDGSGLNNQKSNLEVCTHQENLSFKRVAINSKTGFRGVYPVKDRELFEWDVYKMGKKIGGGYEKILMDAVNAREAFKANV